MELFPIYHEEQAATAPAVQAWEEHNWASHFTSFAFNAALLRLDGRIRCFLRLASTGLRRREKVASRGPSPSKKTCGVQGTPTDSGERVVPLSHCPIYPTSSLRQFGPFPPWTLQYFCDPKRLFPGLPSTCLKKPEFECSREGPESRDDSVAGFLLEKHSGAVTA